MAAKREYKLTVMLSDEEERKLATVADKRGLTASDWIRQSIRLAYESDPALQPSTKHKKR
jgi:predicted transcriptional regulator